MSLFERRDGERRLLLVFGFGGRETSSCSMIGGRESFCSSVGGRVEDSCLCHWLEEESLSCLCWTGEILFCFLREGEHNEIDVYEKIVRLEITTHDGNRRLL